MLSELIIRRFELSLWPQADFNTSYFIKLLFSLVPSLSSPQDGVYIYGLSLDGAGWDKRGMRLIEPSPKVLFAPLPVVHMFALNELSKEQKAQRVSFRQIIIHRLCNLAANRALTVFITLIMEIESRGTEVRVTYNVLHLHLITHYISRVTSHASNFKLHQVYECPVYKKPQRTDLTYITNIRLKTNQSPDYWTLRGAALLCDIK